LQNEICRAIKLKEKIEQASEWDDHTIVIWLNEGTSVIYFPSYEEGQYDVDIFLLL
jgi:hypothetical protein